MEELLKDFLAETAEHIDSISSQLVRFEQDPSDLRIVSNIFRIIHSIKGTCGFLDLLRLGKLTHATETLVGILRDGQRPTPQTVSLILTAIDQTKFIIDAIAKDGVEPVGDDAALILALETNAQQLANETNSDKASELPATAPTPVQEPQAALPNTVPQTNTLAQTPPLAQTNIATKANLEFVHPLKAAPPERRVDSVRLPIRMLDTMMALVSELVLIRNHLCDPMRTGDMPRLKGPLQRLSTMTNDLQREVMRVRMQPLRPMLASFNRLVRDLSVELGKKADLVVHDAGTEIDRQILDIIRDPLTHLIRNALDHGIESPQERMDAGKDETGLITLEARYLAGQVVLIMSDDGRGFHFDKIRIKARQFLKTEDLDGLSDHDLLQLLFAPGFSTAGHVSQISGRGVGLDIVRTNLEQIGGAIEAEHNPQGGARFILKMPLSLAIVPMLVFNYQAQRFAISHMIVEGFVEYYDDTRDVVETINHQRFVKYGKATLPLLDLADYLPFDAHALQTEAPEKLEKIIIIIKSHGRRFGLLADMVDGTQDIVVKALPKIFKGLPCYAGATLLNDGEIVLIFDAVGLADMAGLEASEQLNDSLPTTMPLLPVVMRFVIFEDWRGELWAADFTAIMEICQLDASHFSALGGRQVLTLQDKTYNLITPDGAALNDLPQGSRHSVLLMRHERFDFAILAKRICDSVSKQFEGGKVAFEAMQGSHLVIGEWSCQIVPYARYAASFAESLGIKLETHHHLPQILLVDDNEVYRQFWAKLLTSHGYEVIEAGNALEAITQYGGMSHLCVVLIDLDMPGIDGFGLARRLCQIPANKNERSQPTLIALSSHSAQLQEEPTLPSEFLAKVGKFDRIYLLSLIAKLAYDFNKAA